MRKYTEEDIEKALKLLDDKITNRASSKKKLLSSFSEDTLDLIVPESIFKNLEEMRFLIPPLVKQLNLTLSSFEQPRADNKRSDEEEAFIRGMSYEIHKPSKRLVLKEKSSPIELGKNFVYALRVQAIFEHNDKIGFLKKNHRWFGNDPKATKLVSGKPEAVSYIRNYFKSIMANYLDLEPIIIKLIKMSICSLTSEHIATMLKDQIIEFNEFLSSNFSVNVEHTVQQSKRKTQKVVSKKLPSKPTSTSLFLKEEFDLLNQISSEIFSELKYSRRITWEETVINRSFNSIVDELRPIFNERLKYREAFGRVTTNRLNRIRKFQEKATLRKKDITTEDISRFLSSLEDPFEYLIRNLQSMKLACIERMIKNVLSIEESFDLNIMNAEQKNLLANALYRYLDSSDVYIKAFASKYTLVTIAKEKAQIIQSVYPSLPTKPKAQRTTPGQPTDEKKSPEGIKIPGTPTKKTRNTPKKEELSAAELSFWANLPAKGKINSRNLEANASKSGFKKATGGPSGDKSSAQ